MYMNKVSSCSPHAMPYMSLVVNHELTCTSHESPRFLALEPESLSTTAAYSFVLPEGAIRLIPAVRPAVQLLQIQEVHTWTCFNV